MSSAVAARDTVVPDIARRAAPAVVAARTGVRGCVAVRAAAPVVVRGATVVVRAPSASRRIARAFVFTTAFCAVVARGWTFAVVRADCCAVVRVPTVVLSRAGADCFTVVAFVRETAAGLFADAAGADVFCRGAETVFVAPRRVAARAAVSASSANAGHSPSIARHTAKIGLIPFILWI